MTAKGEGHKKYHWYKHLGLGFSAPDTLPDHETITLNHSIQCILWNCVYENRETIVKFHKLPQCRACWIPPIQSSFKSRFDKVLKHFKHCTNSRVFICRSNCMQAFYPTVPQKNSLPFPSLVLWRSGNPLFKNSVNFDVKKLKFFFSHKEKTN